MKLEDAVALLNGEMDFGDMHPETEQALLIVLSELRMLQEVERWIPMEESKPQDDDMVDVRGVGLGVNGYGAWLTITHWKPRQPLPDATAIYGDEGVDV